MSTILTFSGWTQPADALSAIAPGADHVDYADAPDIDTLARQLAGAPYDVVIGWSLGGIIARELLASGALRARALVSLAAPYQFVRDARVAHAMPAATFHQFYHNYRDDTRRTVSRFHGLVAKGDREPKRVLQALTHHPRVAEVERWLPWMDFLQRHSAENRDYSQLPPSLIVHGSEDAIVPAAQSHLLREVLPQARHRLWEGASHALHLHNPARLQREIGAFVDAC